MTLYQNRVLTNMNSTEEKLLSKDARIKRNEEDFLSTEVDGEAVIMNMESGAYFGLNSVTTDIWNILKEPISVQEVLDKIREVYDVEIAQCEEDTLPVLNQMNQLKIIIPV